MSATTEGAGKICSGIQWRSTAMDHSSSSSAGNIHGQPLSRTFCFPDEPVFKIICDIVLHV